MEINAEQLVEFAVRDGIRDAVKAKFTATYNNPLDKLLDGVVAARATAIRQLLDDALQSCLCDGEFRESIKQSVRHSLAKSLVQRFGGELEKQVNALKSDPTTRARITLAIEAIVSKAGA